MTQPDGAATQLETLRGLVNGATQRLLGDTIAVSDEDWRAPSRLPGWSRGHVASHIARQADGLVRLTDGRAPASGRTCTPRPSSGRPISPPAPTGPGSSCRSTWTPRRVGSTRPSTGWTSEAWDAIVELRGGTKVPARLLPLARLLEVVVHHVDLDIGFEFAAVENATAEWLLEWCAFRVRSREEFPRLDLTSDSGFTISLGNAGEPTAVSGTSANLLGWVMSRVDDSAVSGGEGLQRPPF